MVTETALITVRMAWRNLRHHPGSAVLLLMALSCTTITLALALAVRSTAEAPWDRTFSLTKGPNVIANSESLPELHALAKARGVTATIGPSPFTIADVRLRGYRTELFLVGRRTLKGAVDRPAITSGLADLRGHGVVLERSLANSLGIRIGDRLLVNGLRLTVRGIGISVAQAPFPDEIPGLAWVSPETVRALSPGGRPRAYQIELRLRNGQDASAFVAHYASGSVAGQRGAPYVRTWQNIRTAALADVRKVQIVLLTVSSLLALLAMCSVAVLVVTRMSSRIRQVGTLRAVGFTPAQVTFIVILEYAMVAGIATAVGIVVGSWLAPLVVRPAAALLGTVTTPPVTWTSALEVGSVAIAMVVLAGSRLVLSSTRRSIVDTLAVSPSPPVRATGPARVAVALHLSVPIVLGLLSITRRPATASLAGLSLILSVATGAAALAALRSFQMKHDLAGPQSAGDAQLLRVVYICTAMFIVLGALNTVLVATFAARDSVHNHAVLRAIGCTRAQNIVSLVSAQSATAIGAACIGVPLGLALFNFTYGAVGGGPGAHNPPVLWLAAMAAVSIVLACVLAAIPGYVLSRHSVAPLLAHD
ncbi:MAG: ABC transporter permease [Chloroflexota bacterium]|nr:ABC transporter permease [Chloroflexota bacterium]